MKKLFTLLLILLSTVYSFAQQNYRTVRQSIETPASVVFYGKNTKPEVLSVVYDNIEGNTYSSSYSINQGYDKNGNLTGGNWVMGKVIGPTGEVFGYEMIQLADSTEEAAQTLLDRTSTISSTYARSVCAQQYAALKRLYRMAKNNSYYTERDVRIYETNPIQEETRGCNCEVKIEKKDPVVKLDPDLPSYSAGAYSGYNANFGALPNQIPATDFSQVTIVKEKGKYGWVWKTLAGVVIGYILTDGLSDGEWFDFNFEKPQTIVIDGPPGGPDLNPSSLILRTSNYQLQQQLQSMMPQNNAPPSIGFSFNIGL